MLLLDLTRQNTHRLWHTGLGKEQMGGFTVDGRANPVAATRLVNPGFLGKGQGLGSIVFMPMVPAHSLGSQHPKRTQIPARCVTGSKVPCLPTVFVLQKVQMVKL